MHNRIQHLLRNGREPVRCTDYVVVSGDFGTLFVTRDTAEHLARQLKRPVTPRWLEFRTVIGAHVSVRTRDVEALMESTAALREAARQFWRDLDEEERNDRRPWDPE
jgi:hypothetical protein